VSSFFKRGDDLERELRRNRPEPRAEFLATMVDRVSRERRSTAPRMRLGFAGALTAMIVLSMAAFGGLGYAATAVHSVAHVATKIVAPAKHKSAVKPLSAASAQYGAPTKICHFDGKGRGHDLTVDASAVPAHLAHGDHRGNCRAGEFKPGSAAAKAAAKKKAALKKAAAAKKAKGVLGTTVSGVSPSTTG